VADTAVKMPYQLSANLLKYQPQQTRK